MSVIRNPRESHKRPQDFRIKYEDAAAVLGPHASIAANDAEKPQYLQSKIAMIGAGVSGITAAMTCLKKGEDDFAIFEKHDEFGGTWYANTYPGCACDIPAVWYSFHDEVNSTWSEVQPPQYELEEYILKVVEKHGIRKKAFLGTAVTSLKFNDKASNWSIEACDVKTGKKRIHTAQIVLSGQGFLVQPKQLSVPGLEDKFQGEYMHSAVWNHNVDFQGKNVVVVGNGCSANQCVPVLLRDYGVQSLTQIARLKHYIMPPIPGILHQAYQTLAATRLGILLVRYVAAMVAELRFPLFKNYFFLTSIITWINHTASTRYVKKTCPKQYQDLVIPDFHIGCKRLIFDHGYMPALHDKRMELTDSTIERVEANSVILINGKRIPADIIVACTGYDVVKSYHSFDIVGRNNIDIQALWNKEGITAYETVLVRDCPNLFLIGGPNATTGHSSMILAIENACNYFAKIATPVLNGLAVLVCVKTEKYYKWFETVQEELKHSVFGTPLGGCVSWYTQGGVNSTTYPWSQITYWWRMLHPKWGELEYEKKEKKEKVA